MRYLLFLLLAIAIVYSQYPGSTSNVIYKTGIAQPELCYSMCLSCQTTNLSYCNNCESPYLKSIPPICNITDQYNMIGWELWENVPGSGAGGIPGNFTLSPYWSTNAINTQSANCGPYFVYGPFVAGSVLTYSRAAPIHHYIIIKFFFIRIDWTTSDSVNFVYSSSQTNTYQQLILQYVGNGSISNSQLVGACDRNFNPSSDSNDMVSSVQLKYFDRGLNPSLFNASFSSSLGFSANAAWALNTFLVIAGRCNDGCYTCDYSFASTACLTCVNLLSQATDRSCSICGPGRYMITASQCRLCPINCITCSASSGTLLCLSCPSTMNLTASGTCQYSTASNNYFLAALEANTQQFGSSFWSIVPTPSQNIFLTTCGKYSFIGGQGITSPNSLITRIFSSLPSHVSISIRANYLKVDRISDSSQILRIYVDGQLIDNQTVILSGSSNQCGAGYLDTIAAIETGFIPHTNNQNVNISFNSDAASWGIRDIMVVINNCGPNCALCTSSGCQACSGFLRLVGVACVGCLPGFAPLTNSTCISCDSSCMSCEAASGNCTGCYGGFLLINGRCIIGGSGWDLALYNLGGYGNMTNNAFTYNSQTSSTLFGGNLNELVSSGTTSIDTSGWSYNSVINNASVLSCQYVDLTNPNFNSNNQIVHYLLSENRISKTFTQLPPHSRVRVMYTLMKIDDWGSDPLDVYFNDLLVNQDVFTGAKNGGNNICGNPNQNQYLYTGDITINDSNSTLTIDFQAQNAPGQSRYFAIKNLMVMVYNCENCDSESFTYKLDYAVNNSATAYVEFNQAIAGMNYGLTFQQIFQLYLNGKRLNYTARSVPHNNKLWLLDFNPGTNNIVDGNLSLLSVYPSAVVTNSQILNPNGNGNRISAQSKSLDNNLASTSFKRYDPITSSSPYNLRRAFNVLTKIMFFASIIAFLFGFQTAFVGPIHNLQILWLHIYVASKYIPSNLKVSLEGFRYIQDLNFWSNGIQDTIGFGVTGDNVVFDSPAEYMAYHYDVAFFRHIYAIGMFACIFWVIFGILILLFRNIPMLRVSMCWLIRYYRYITNRVMWMVDSVFFFTFVTLCFAVFAQFQDVRMLKSPYTNLQLGGTVIALIFTIFWPLFQAFYLRYQYRDPNFNYFYGQIHYRFYQSKEHYFDFWRVCIYQLFRYGQIFWICIVFALLYKNYYAQIILLILTFAFHIAFLLWGRLFNSPHISIYILKIIELIGFIGLQVIIIICFASYQSLSERSYSQLGYAGVFFLILVVVCSFIRIFILLYLRIMFMFMIPDLQATMIPAEVTIPQSNRMLPMANQFYYY